MKYYIIAGEASGDLHAANLIKELRKRDTHADIRFWGGDKMLEAGGTQVMHYKDTAFMGFLEVAKNLPTILNFIKFCKQDIQAYKPDAIILVDYPGFNLRIAKWAKEAGFTVYYYISPTVWAWKASRVHIVGKNVRKMFTILPFEKAFYKKYNYDVEYCGHPLLDAIAQYKPVLANLVVAPDNLLLLLPGSRKQEVEAMLPVMLQAAATLPGARIVIAGVNALPESLYKSLTAGYTVEVVYNQTYDMLSQARAAIVTSGTASLETALFNVPQMIVYKTSTISFTIAKWVANVKYIGLPNLIMDAPVVKELIQDDFTINNITAELGLIWNDTPRRKEILEQYAILKQKLGISGASSCVAQKIWDDLQIVKAHPTAS